MAVDRPAWLARAAERAGGERPEMADAIEYATAYVEYAAVMLLADALDRNAALDPSVELALRLSMNVEMGFQEWRCLFDLLGKEPHAKQVLGYTQDAVFPPAHPVSDATRAASGRVDEDVRIGDFLDALSERQRTDAALLIVQAIHALVDDSPVMVSHPLQRVLSVEPDDEGFLVRHGCFEGIGPAKIHTTRFTEEPPVSAQWLYFWSLTGRAVAIPAWLAYFESGMVRVYSGRETGSRHWLYKTRMAGDAPALVKRRIPAPGAPLVLAEPTWMTPIAARRRLSFDRSPSPDSEPKADSELEATSMTGTVDRVEHVRLHASLGPDTLGGAGRILRVLNGRGMMRYAELGPQQSVVIGRHPAFADLPVHHREVSRTHARIWSTTDDRVLVQDMRSTNGTTLNGAEVTQDPPVAVQVGDVVGVGPIRLRLELPSAPYLDRLARVSGLLESGGTRRDPLTQLLKPRYLAVDLNKQLGRGFGDERVVSGVLFTIERIGQLHAQEGQATADMAFHNVSMVAMAETGQIELATRVGYGEVLLVCVDLGLGEAEALAKRVLGAVAAQVVLPCRELTAIAAVGQLGSEPVDTWISRLRQASGASRPSGEGVFRAEPS